MRAERRIRSSIPVVALAVLVLSACTRSPSSASSPTPRPSPNPSAATTSVSPSPAASSDGGPPAPDAAIPRGVVALAGVAAETTRELYAAIDRWLAADPHAMRTPPEDVQLLALYQQRITRALAHAPRLADRVVARLPHPVAVEIGADITASQALFRHSPTIHRKITLRTQPPAPAGELLSYYKEAQARFGVAWQVLAAVNGVESRFGRTKSASSAGAQGPMQFIPSTWATYGMGGDVQDPHDAILGAANFLHASGAPDDYRAALYSYNPINDYGTAVLAYARQMMRVPRSFYEYYNWQVFVFTTRGEVRLTGPGL